MGRAKESARIISKLTGEIAVTAVDLIVLAAAAAGGFFLYGPSGKDLNVDYKTKKALAASDRFFTKWNQSSFRRAVGRAAGEGLIKRMAGGYELTEDGREKLRELLPDYKKQRSWDGRLWLITYDIPENIKKKREKFRKFLAEIGCRMVQESVWLSLKDPRGWVTGRINSLRLQGRVIVSCLGKDGSLGDEDTAKMVARIFKLKNINRQYRRWINQAKNTQKAGIFHHGLRFLAILRDDPVVPQKLLPADWTGEAALELFDEKFRPQMGLIGDYLIDM